LDTLTYARGSLTCISNTIRVCTSGKSCGGTHPLSLFWCGSSCTPQLWIDWVQPTLGSPCLFCSHMTPQNERGSGTWSSRVSCTLGIVIAAATHQIAAVVNSVLSIRYPHSQLWGKISEKDLYKFWGDSWIFCIS
jgi:hypothetical protein